MSNKNVWVMVLLIIIQILLSVTASAAPQTSTEMQTTQTRWYAGYYYYNYEGPSCIFKGVRSRIYTINVPIAEDEAYAEWVTVILRYYPKYWVQVGYYKGWYTGYVLRYYIEKYDSNGHTLIILYDMGTPSHGEWHIYEIKQPAYGVNWNFYIDYTYAGSFSTNPSCSRDLQAFVETWSPYVNIDESHFQDISYRLILYNRPVWILWDRHEPRSDDPYWICEVSHHEFLAGGGEEPPWTYWWR